MILKELTGGMLSPAVARANFAYMQTMSNVNPDWKMLSDIDPKYNPALGNQINIPFMLAPRKDVRVYLAQPNPKLLAKIIQGDKVLFAYHPAAGELFKEKPSGEISTIPTASLRTVMTLDQGYDFMMKMHLPLRHYGFNRWLMEAHAKLSTAVSNGMTQADFRQTRFGYLSETIAVAYIVDDKNEEKNFSVIYREEQARPYRARRQLIPGQSLPALDPKHKEDPTLLIQMVKEFGGKKPHLFFVENILGLLQDGWEFFQSQLGYAPEHIQNWLFEIDLHGKPRRIIIQDFEGMHTDEKLRRDKGFQIFERDVFSEKERSEVYSLSYDFLLGEYTFKQLIEVFVQEYQQYETGELEEMIKKRFNDTASEEIKDLLPSDSTYMYGGHREGGNATLRRSDNKPRYR